MVSQEEFRVKDKHILVINEKLKTYKEHPRLCIENGILWMYHDHGKVSGFNILKKFNTLSHFLI
jgi:hypothetical protein